MKNLTKLMFAIALTSVALTGCKEKDLYDPSYKEAELAANFTSEFGDVAADQNFNTSESATLTATVDLDYGVTYTLGIFEGSPINNSSAIILAKTSITSGETVELSFTKSKVDTTFFAAVIYPNGYMAAKPFACIDGEATVSFVNSSTSSASLMSAKSAMRTRAVSSDGTVTVETMSAPDFDSYLDGATELTSENNTTNPDNTITKYKISSGTWTDNIPLLQSANGITLYVADGATLQINQEQRVNMGNTIVVASGGTVEIASGVTLRTNADGGTGTRGMIYVQSGATVKGEGTLEFSNGTTEYSYNGGTIDVGTLNINGGTLYNANGATLYADDLRGGASNSTLINQGKVIVGTAGSSNWWSTSEQYAGLILKNNCYFESKDGLQLGGATELGDGSYTKASNVWSIIGSDHSYTDNQNYIAMGHNAVLVAEDNLSISNHGIVGPSSNSTGEAYVYFGQCSSANYGNWNNKNEWIYNYVNLVHTGSTEGSGYTNLTTYMLNGYAADCGWSNAKCTESEKVAESTTGILTTKESDDCSPAIIAKEDTITTETVYYNGKTYTVAFEDLGSTDDFDFNDIVLYVTVGGYSVTYTYTNGEVTSTTENGNNDGVTVRVMAAGGTLPIEVYYDSQLLYSKSTSEMLNTTSFNGVLATVTLDGVSASGFDMGDAETIKNFKIKVDGTTESYFVSASTDKGDTPQAIVIGTAWSWPTERTNIGTSYPAFKKWVGDTIYGDWYESGGVSVITPSNY